MAILDSLPGVVVTVCVDGKPLEAHVDKSEVVASRFADKRESNDDSSPKREPKRPRETVDLADDQYYTDHTRHERF